jgi:hypothetical protein
VIALPSLPPTLLLQIAVSAMGTAIGAFSLAASRRAVAARPAYRATWGLTGVTFVLMGVCGLVQSGLGSWAILAGQGTPAWSRYMLWAPALNYSRSTAEVAFLGLVVVCVLRREHPAPLSGGFAWLAVTAALLLGGALGWGEGSMVTSLHYQRVALTDSAIFALWALVLSVAMVADVVDRWLLTALGLSAIPLPLNALWFAWLARAETGAWTPRPFDMQLYRIAFHALVLAAVVHRWRLARRGIPVQGLAGRPTPSLR